MCVISTWSNEFFERKYLIKECVYVVEDICMAVSDWCLSLEPSVLHLGGE